MTLIRYCRKQPRNNGIIQTSKELYKRSMYSLKRGSDDDDASKINRDDDSRTVVNSHLNAYSPTTPKRIYSKCVSPTSSSRKTPQQRMFSTTNTNTSVSKEEVSKFSALASNWYDSTSNPLIGMNPVRLSYIQQILRQQQQQHPSPSSSSPLKGLRVLDVGCGGGLLSISLAKLGAHVVAIDPSVEIVNVAHEYYTRTQRHSSLSSEDDSGSIDFRGGVSVEDLAQEYLEKKEALFDVVCILEVIEHTNDPHSLLSAASSLLKPPTSSSSNDADGESGGTLFLSTINQTLKSYAFAILGAEYIAQKLPVGTHSYSLFRSPSQVLELMKGVGLKERSEVCGMVVEPSPFILRDMNWKLDRKDVDVNWIGAYCRST